MHGPTTLEMFQEGISFFISFCKKYLNTNKLPKFAHSWIWHNINVLCWDIVMYAWNLSVSRWKVQHFIKWFEKLKWHVPLIKDYFRDVLRLLGIGINFWKDEYDNKKHVAITNCDVECNVHKGKTPCKYLWGSWDDNTHSVFVAHRAPASIVVYSNFFGFRQGNLIRTQRIVGRLGWPHNFH